MATCVGRSNGQEAFADKSNAEGVAHLDDQIVALVNREARLRRSREHAVGPFRCALVCPSSVAMKQASDEGGGGGGVRPDAVPVAGSVQRGQSWRRTVWGPTHCNHSRGNSVVLMRSNTVRKRSIRLQAEKTGNDNYLLLDTLVVQWCADVHCSGDCANLTGVRRLSSEAHRKFPTLIVTVFHFPFQSARLTFADVSVICVPASGFRLLKGA